MPRLSIIIGSTRPGRAGLPIARWFTERARRHGAFDLDVVDLAELNLPLLDEPEHPRLRRYTHQHTRDWSARVEAADAFVLVTPEYNHGYPAALKNALDFVCVEWRHKPVGFVSYGGVAAGARAVQALEPVVSALQMVGVVEAVTIPFHVQFLNDGRFDANLILERAADAMLDAVARMEAVLRPLRADDEERRAAA